MQIQVAAHEWPVFKCPSLAGFDCPLTPIRLVQPLFVGMTAERWIAHHFLAIS
jgi:hypothetical protein